jgi:hypothetical protein
MDSDKTVTAIFTLNYYTLTATALGNGSGTVRSGDNKISFAYPAVSSGSASVPYGSSMVLTAAASSGSTVTWTGNCDSTGGTSTSATCTINTMKAAKNVAATFSSSMIRVVKPNGGEVLKQKIAAAISWSYAGNPGTYVKIDLLKAGVLKKTIVSKTTIGKGGAGTYLWRPSTAETPGNDYTVRITSVSNNIYTDASNAPFAIVGNTTMSQLRAAAGLRNNPGNSLK